ncbi:MAG: hypothetical protein NC253_06665 [Ruminococcus sp.]|nr:hypothetical protein [Ruminococcus sp.]MCM1479116.1 hypothetical protein [Muribaculaceae bacterium]
MCRIMEEIREEGIEEGIEETSAAIAVRLINKGKNSIEEIAEVTDLPIERVEQLAKQAATVTV